MSSRSGRGCRSLSDGTFRIVDQVVLAPGASPPAWPLPLGGTGQRWIGDPWAPDALARIRPGEPVLLVGTGLTAVDTALSLQPSGHRIVATSRHGWLPGTHSDRPLPPLRLAPPRCPTALSLMAWARAQVTEVGDWRPVVDALRPHTDHLWGAMTETDRLRLLRHTGRRWEVLRHRMPAAVAVRIESMRRTGQLTLLPGDIGSARQTPGGIEVTIGDQHLRVGAVINCTGPSTEVRRSRHPLVRRLLARRVIHPGPLGLGLDTTVDGHLGAGAGALWLLGPLRRGRCWESTAIPEIRTQAADLPRSLWRLDAMVGA